MAYLLQPTAFFPIRNDDATLMPAARLEAYLSGTTVPTSTFTDESGGTEHTWPVVADIHGQLPPIFLDPNIAYRIKLKDPDGAEILDLDPIAIEVPDTIATDAELAALSDSLTDAMEALDTELRAALIRPVASVAAMIALTDVATGQKFYVMDPRQEGVFEAVAYSSVTTEVTADSYGGIYVRSTGVPAIAFKRVVTGSTYQFEWWLPETMGTDCHLRFNSMMGLVSTGATINLANRQMTVSGTSYVTKACEIIGHGRAGIIWGNGGNLNAQIMLIIASNVTLRGVYGGGTYGVQAGQSESPVFHVYDGQSSPVATTRYSVENVRFYDCGAIQAMTGIRIGYSSVAGSTVYQSRNCVIDGFYGENMLLYLFEIGPSQGTRVSNFYGKMGLNYNSGVQKMIRLMAPKDCIITNGRMVGYSDNDVTQGIVFDMNDAKYPNSFDCPRDVQISNLAIENCAYGIALGPCDGVALIENVLFSGRTNGYVSGLPMFIFAAPTGTIFTRQQLIERLIVRNCTAVNAVSFGIISGYIKYFLVEENDFISCDNASAFFLKVQGYSASEFLHGRICRNRSNHKANVNPPIVFGGTLDADSVVDISDNDFTKSTPGDQFFVPPAATVVESIPNRAVDAAFWALERPSFDSATYS